jgi:hypothetical protein
MLSGICWSSCEYMKFKLRKMENSFGDAMNLYIRNYPEL